MAEIHLDDLRRARPGLSPAYGGALCEAAAVCLEEQGHLPGVELITEGSLSQRHSLGWRPPSEQAIPTWADEEFATEQGAYGVAILLLERWKGWTVLERSRKGTGFDYWVGASISEQAAPFQETARLEVSGLRSARRSQVLRRVRQKMRQVSRGPLPALVIVTEFGFPYSYLTEDR